MDFCVESLRSELDKPRERSGQKERVTPLKLWLHQDEMRTHWWDDSAEFIPEDYKWTVDLPSLRVGTRVNLRWTHGESIRESTDAFVVGFGIKPPFHQQKRLDLDDWGRSGDDQQIDPECIGASYTQFLWRYSWYHKDGICEPEQLPIRVIFNAVRTTNTGYDNYNIGMTTPETHLRFPSTPPPNALLAQRSTVQSDQELFSWKDVISNRGEGLTAVSASRNLLQQFLLNLADSWDGVSFSREEFEPRTIPKARKLRDLQIEPDALESLFSAKEQELGHLLTVILLGAGCETDWSHVVYSRDQLILPTKTTGETMNVSSASFLWLLLCTGPRLIFVSKAVRSLRRFAKKAFKDGLTDFRPKDRIDGAIVILNVAGLPSGSNSNFDGMMRALMDVHKGKDGSLNKFIMKSGTFIEIMGKRHSALAALEHAVFRTTDKITSACLLMEVGHETRTCSPEESLTRLESILKATGASGLVGLSRFDDMSGDLPIRSSSGISRLNIRVRENRPLPPAVKDYIAAEKDRGWDGRKALTDGYTDFFYWQTRHTESATISEFLVRWCWELRVNLLTEGKDVDEGMLRHVKREGNRKTGISSLEDDISLLPLQVITETNLVHHRQSIVDDVVDILQKHKAWSDSRDLYKLVSKQFILRKPDELEKTIPDRVLISLSAAHDGKLLPNLRTTRQVFIFESRYPTDRGSDSKAREWIWPIGPIPNFLIPRTLIDVKSAAFRLPVDGNPNMKGLLFRLKSFVDLRSLQELESSFLEASAFRERVLPVIIMIYMCTRIWRQPSGPDGDRTASDPDLLFDHKETYKLPKPTARAEPRRGRAFPSISGLIGSLYERLKIRKVDRGIINVFCDDHGGLYYEALSELLRRLMLGALSRYIGLQRSPQEPRSSFSDILEVAQHRKGSQDVYFEALGTEIGDSETEFANKVLSDGSLTISAKAEIPLHLDPCLLGVIPLWIDDGERERLVEVIDVGMQTLRWMYEPILNSLKDLEIQRIIGQSTLFCEDSTDPLLWPCFASAFRDHHSELRPKVPPDKGRALMKVELWRHGELSNLACWAFFLMPDKTERTREEVSKLHTDNPLNLLVGVEFEATFTTRQFLSLPWIDQGIGMPSMFATEEKSSSDGYSEDSSSQEGDPFQPQEADEADLQELKMSYQNSYYATVWWSLVHKKQDQESDFSYQIQENFRRKTVRNTREERLLYASPVLLSGKQKILLGESITREICSDLQSKNPEIKKGSMKDIPIPRFEAPPPTVAEAQLAEQKLKRRKRRQLFHKANPTANRPALASD